MQFNKFLVFFFESHFLMVFLLFSNVSAQCRNLRFTGRKCAKANLPGKLSIQQLWLIDAMGRCSFDLFHYLTNSQIRMEEKLRVNVISSAIKTVQMTFTFRKFFANKSVNGYFNFRGNNRFSILYSDDSMDPDFDFWVRHDLNCVFNLNKWCLYILSTHDFSRGAVTGS